MRSALGKYRLLTTLGRGGMAEVFLAVLEGEASSRKLVVIKCIRSELTSDPDLLRMFLDEARLALRLNHPNVVHTFEVDMADGEYFLAMEFLDGQPLNQIRATDQQRPGTFTVAMKLQIVADALRGLHYAHELRDYDGTPLGVVHRDVSPHNLFVTYDGQVKIVDFGIAKAARRLQEATKTDVSPKGKVKYMSPEQARSEKVDARADVFAMGVVLWELLTGRRLWPDREDMDVLLALYHHQLPPLDADLDPDLIALCARALAPQRDDRFASAEAFRQAVAAYQASRGMLVSGVELGQRMLQVFAASKAEVDQLIVDQMRALPPPAPPGQPRPAPAAPPVSLADTSPSHATRIDQRGRSKIGAGLAFGGVIAVAAATLLVLRAARSPASVPLDAAGLPPAATATATATAAAAATATTAASVATAAATATTAAPRTSAAPAASAAPTATAPAASPTTWQRGSTTPTGAGKPPAVAGKRPPPPAADTSLPAFLP